MRLGHMIQLAALFLGLASVGNAATLLGYLVENNGRTLECTVSSNSPALADPGYLGLIQRWIIEAKNSRVDIRPGSGGTSPRYEIYAFDTSVDPAEKVLIAKGTAEETIARDGATIQALQALASRLCRPVLSREE